MVAGNLDDLGNWNSIDFQLEWTEGDVWESDKPVFVPKSKHYFEYKYCVVTINPEDGTS